MSEKTKAIVGMGLLTAIVVVLQVAAVVIKPTGLFTISLVLVPIVVGSALYGWKAGIWLGFVFGMVVLFTDASLFLAVNIPGTVIVCLLKGMLAGLVSGLIYTALKRFSVVLAAIAAAVVCPIVNTGVFLLGCAIFFMDTINEWAEGAGYENTGAYMILVLVGVNFIVELVVNVVLPSTIVKIIDLLKK